MLDQDNYQQQIIHDYLQLVYKDIPCPTDKKLSSPAHTSGEILLPSLNTLFKNINLSPSDVLIDLGCGRGNLILYTFLMQKLKKVIGIEIRGDLYSQARHAWQRIQGNLANCLASLPEVTFLLGDFLTVSLNEVSIALINSTCFGPDLMCNLAYKLDNTPSIHTVCTLRPLPNVKRLICQKIISTQCSWDEALCYIYTTKKGSADNSLGRRRCKHSRIVNRP